MKKTYVTTMPDHVGAFLKASRCMASLGLNITRASYNKAIDTHTLFIEAEGEPDRLELATEELRKIGYLQSSGKQSVLLVEFKLRECARQRIRRSGTDRPVQLQYLLP